MAEQQRFTEAEVEYLVKAKKYIFAIPEIEQEEGGSSVMQAEVRRKDDPNWQKGGLLISARVKKALPGLPRGSPSCSLRWYGRRIRGVNYEVWHDNPDSSSVRGWHEHIWNGEDRDARVIQASPAIAKPDLRNIFRWGLSKWNIEITEEQKEMD
jgi:hypothetical protein